MQKFRPLPYPPHLFRRGSCVELCGDWERGGFGGRGRRTKGREDALLDSALTSLFRDICWGLLRLVSGGEFGAVARGKTRVAGKSRGWVGWWACVVVCAVCCVVHSVCGEVRKRWGNGERWKDYSILCLRSSPMLGEASRPRERECVCERESDGEGGRGREREGGRERAALQWTVTTHSKPAVLDKESESEREREREEREGEREIISDN